MNLLEVAAEFRLDHFLSQRRGVAHVVMPRPMQEAVRALAPDAGWTASDTLDGVPLRMGMERLFVHHPVYEAQWLREARIRFPQLEVLGLLHHVVPRLACSPKGRQGALNVVPVAMWPATRYAVLSPSRAGATFYSELLTAGGLGQVREILRPPVVHVWNSPAVDRQVVFEDVLRCGQVADRFGGIFGTRVTGHFLMDAVGRDALAATLQCLVDKDFRFILLRRDVLAQAVSRYTARNAAVWQSRGPLKASQLERLAAVLDDPDGMRQSYAACRMETEALAAAVASLPADRLLTADFQHFTTRPLDALAEAATFLGRPVDTSRVDLAALPLSISAQAPGWDARRAAMQAAIA